MATWKWVVSLVIILVIGWGLYSLISAKNQLNEQTANLSAQASGLMKENAEISGQIDYLKNPDNLKKVLMEQTSYRPADEKMFIITSGNTSTLNTSTATSTKK
ncbi:MAG: hypothetical protein ABSE68_01285 [Minisyncoccia bacterium]